MVFADEKKCPRTYEMDAGESDRTGSPWLFWRKRRYTVAIMAFLGFINVYFLRVNLSVAIVDMTALKNITLENGTVFQKREFDWSNHFQGYLLSSFFYGYITTQMAGGYLATRYGGRLVFGTGVLVTAVLTLLTPWLVVVDSNLFLAIRIIEGIFEGVTVPCIHAVWAKWAPPLERSRLATLTFSGIFVGTVIGMPLSAFIVNTFGWQSVFYFFGALGVFWYICWMVLIADSPEKDSRITPEEKKYILETLNRTDCNKPHPKLPWRSVLLSAPVWAITASHFSENWGFYTLLTQLPKYLKETMDYDLGQSGFLSALPYLVLSVVIQFAGHWADRLQEKGILTTTQVRKVFNCPAFVFQAVFMTAAAYWSDKVGTVFCLTMAVGLGGFAWAGFSVNHLDIAPQHAGVLMGLGNTFATLPGIVSPILTGYIVPTENATSQQWQVVFYISAGIYVCGALIYGLFASGELQPWAIESEPLKSKNPENVKGQDNNGFMSDVL